MSSALSFRGVYTALVTPFTNEGAVDFDAYLKLLDRQIDAGIAGLVPLGTTGESPTITKDEKHEIIKRTVEHVAGRVPVIVGTGSNSTADSVENTRWAKEAGASACLLVNPYYNKPSQAGIIAHVKAVAAVGLPVVLYNIPGRTGINATPATIAELSKVPGVVAIKEATGSLDQASEIASLCSLPILSGDDSLTLPLMSVGACGVVSVLSNLIPERVVGMVDKALKGDFAGARADHLALFPLFKNMFIDTNPVPVKRAMELRGYCTSAVRLPLVGMTEDNDAKLRAVLRAGGVIA